ncbi:hypothetical protein GW835_02775 [archaeon]|nr:hypothetical protein [archaeon]NCP79465.1 hypothetical protein [archaeon]NCP97408.1 hypothetical protein [archaeon]NCQ07232.1 hypothetical protein [archaeon]NCQ51028.1 hypothetical protein [archaeon]
MNYKNILFGITLALLIFNSTMVFAESKDIRYYYENIDEVKIDFVNNIEQLPKIAQNAIKNDKMKIEIQTTEEPLEIFIERLENKEYKVTKENIENVNVWITGKEEVINRILEAEDPMTEINQAFKTKELEIKTKGFFRSIKYKIAKLFLR